MTNSTINIAGAGGATVLVGLSWIGIGALLADDHILIGGGVVISVGLILLGAAPPEDVEDADADDEHTGALTAEDLDDE